MICSKHLITKSASRAQFCTVVATAFVRSRESRTSDEILDGGASCENYVKTIRRQTKYANIQI